MEFCVDISISGDFENVANGAYGADEEAVADVDYNADNTDEKVSVSHANSVD